MLFVLALLAAEQLFELRGRVDPPAPAYVSLQDSASPFTDTATTLDGRFRFRRLRAGTYVVNVLVPEKGDVRVTVAVGPGSADEKGRVEITVPLEDGRITRESAVTVSAAQLRVPAEARREVRRAIERLRDRRTEEAIVHLNRAVEIAPAFGEAWNQLGTVAYRSGRYPDAESYFRKAHAADPENYSPIVNLGGVLLTLNRPQEAWQYNVRAVLLRPNEALANSQLGINALMLGDFTAAEKYLALAIRLDPAHFSNPHLYLAEVQIRQGRRREAADTLTAFLRHRPDYERARDLRARIERMKR